MKGSKSFIPVTVLALACALALTGCHSSNIATNGSVASQAQGRRGASGDDRSTRLPVKHATDPGAASIGLDPKDTTIGDLLGQQTPDGDLSSKEFDDKRVAPFETTVWRLKAHVDSVQHRKDGDYYLVISDSSGKQTVVEVPDPSQCKGSPLESQIAATRKDIETRFHPTDESTKVDADATITGVGFFGFRARPGGRGPANGARLMPGLGFDWAKK